MRNIPVEKKQKMSKKTLYMIIAGAAAVILIVATALTTYISSQNYDKTWIGNTHGNVANRAVVAEHNGKLYFADDAIYEVDESNQCREVIDYEGTDLVIHDGYLYFVNYDDNQYIYRANLETYETELVSAVSGGYINIVDNVLYYASLYGTSYSGIYKMDLANIDPQNPEQITIDWAENLLYYDGRLYFVNEADAGRLYSINLDGSNRAVSAGRATSCFTFYEGNLYYVNVYGTFRAKPDGSNRTQLSEIRASSLNVHNDKIYQCHNAGQGGNYDQQFYCMDLNGNNVEVLTTDSANNICCLEDGFIYFRNVYKSYELYRIDEENTVFENVLKLYNVN